MHSGCGGGAAATEVREEVGGREREREPSKPAFSAAGNVASNAALLLPPPASAVFRLLSVFAARTGSEAGYLSELYHSTTGLTKQSGVRQERSGGLVMLGRRSVAP